jgi:hypothetical protein
MRHHYARAVIVVALASLAAPFMTASASAKPSLPDPCKLLSVHQVNKALHKPGAKPEVARNHAHGTRQCGWAYSREYLVLTVQRQPAHGEPIECKPGSTTKHVHSLGPDGIVCRDNHGGPAGTDPETYVVFTRHHIIATIYLDRQIHPPKPLIKLAKIVRHKI